METIKIKYFTDKIDKLCYIVAEDVVMKKGEFRLIRLGVAMELPQGYEAHVVPRSSTYKNFGLIQTNHMGVIDESYKGDADEWKWPALAMRDTEVHVGDRLCQFRIMKHQPQINFLEVDSLENEDRGGFGTSGTN